MDLEGVGYVLHPHTVDLTELHCLELELCAVARQLSRTLVLAIRPPSVVRPECLLYRVKCPDGSNALLGVTGISLNMQATGYGT